MYHTLLNANHQTQNIVQKWDLSVPINYYFSSKYFHQPDQHMIQLLLCRESLNVAKVLWQSSTKPTMYRVQ